jgi:hypothetical protein
VEHVRSHSVLDLRVGQVKGAKQPVHVGSAKGDIGEQLHKKYEFYS